MEDLESTAHKVFSAPCGFAWATRDPHDFPLENKPEVALAGCSNVGKSCLLNAILGRKLLARTSAHPGHTRALNFYDIAGGNARLLDMPGYGYAKVSQAERVNWQNLIQDCLQNRKVLRALFLLLDVRRGLKPSDKAFLDSLTQAGVPARIVLTKADKFTPIALEQAQEDMTKHLKTYPSAFPEPLMTSVKTGQGIAALRVSLAQILGLM